MFEKKCHFSEKCRKINVVQFIIFHFFSLILNLIVVFAKVVLILMSFWWFTFLFCWICCCFCAMLWTTHSNLVWWFTFFSFCWRFFVFSCLGSLAGVIECYRNPAKDSNTPNSQRGWRILALLGWGKNTRISNLMSVLIDTSHESLRGSAAIRGSRDEWWQLMSEKLMNLWQIHFVQKITLISSLMSVLTNMANFDVFLMIFFLFLLLEISFFHVWGLLLGSLNVTEIQRRTRTRRTARGVGGFWRCLAEAKIHGFQIWCLFWLTLATNRCAVAQRFVAREMSDDKWLVKINEKNKLAKMIKITISNQNYSQKWCQKMMSANWFQKMSTKWWTWFEFEFDFGLICCLLCVVCLFVCLLVCCLLFVCLFVWLVGWLVVVVIVVCSCCCLLFVCLKSSSTFIFWKVSYM